MPAALQRGEFVLEFQPLVRLTDTSAAGAEALVRWRHPRLGWLAPDRFVSLAEETGLIVPIGAWVLHDACRHAVRWQAPDAEPVFVSVNLAARQVSSPGVVESVSAVLTETAAMGTTGEPLRALQRLADMGVRITVDDFGTGYSNLAYLRELPVHGLKLAGSFVEGLRGRKPDHVDSQIVASLVEMAHALGLSVTAEGVEEQAQADRLRDLGCDLAQGFYFARPAPADHIGALLRADLHPVLPDDR
jgi:EAL domain-containing protein (putative c-di-GMP-specific phosphodiesterase class I)